MSILRSAEARGAGGVEQRSCLPAAGQVVVDLYEPAAQGRVPLVLVAHGFWRSRSNMAGWGRHLAGQGYLAAVPDLPAWSDQARNGRAINQLLTWLLVHPPDRRSIDPDRIALVGVSAGGLVTLLAGADNPGVRVWIGLDPVDRGGAGAAAAPRMAAQPFIVTAELSQCNAHGNASAIARSLAPRAAVVSIPGASHADAEWPTDWKARLACGGSSDERRALFVDRTTAALQRAFAEHDGK
jgi:dienelactone hydrolase